MGTQGYLLSLISQTESWIEGKPKHNNFSNECCLDFSCCVPDMLSGEDKRLAIGTLEILQYREELEFYKAEDEVKGDKQV